MPLLLGLLCASSAVARATPPGPRAVVKHPLVGGALERGLLALSQKDLPAAGRLLEEAYRLSPRSEVLYHLGRLAEAEGKTLAAHDLFRRYLADPARDPDEEASREAARLISLPPPPFGTVSVQSDPGAIVLADARVVGSLPLLFPLLLAPGPHTVTLEFSNKRVEEVVQVASGRLVEMQVSRSSGVVVLSVLPAIVHFSQRQGVAAADGRLLFDVLEQAARGERHTLLEASLGLSQAAELKDCLGQERCQRQLAKKNQSRFVLDEKISVQGEGKRQRFELALRLLRVEIAAPAAVVTSRCENCTAAMAAARLKEAMNKLLSDGLFRPHGTLTINVEPASAMVRLDEAAAVPAPLSAPLWSGSHALVVTAPGFQEERRTVEVQQGQSEPLRIDLSRLGGAAEVVANPSPGGLGARLPRPRWRWALGGTFIGLGLGMSIVGGLSMSVDSQCTSPPELDGGECRLQNDTLLPGGIALGSGLVLVGAGVVLLALPGPRQR